MRRTAPLRRCGMLRREGPERRLRLWLLHHRRLLHLARAAPQAVLRCAGGSHSSSGSAGRRSGREGTLTRVRVASLAVLVPSRPVQAVWEAPLPEPLSLWPLLSLLPCPPANPAGQAEQHRHRVLRSAALRQLGRGGSGGGLLRHQGCGHHPRRHVRQAGRRVHHLEQAGERAGIGRGPWGGAGGPSLCPSVDTVL